MKKPFMRPVWVALIWMACANGVLAGAFEDAESALKEKDYRIALEIFKKLAEQGDIQSALRLGQIYCCSNLPRDEDVAKRWFQAPAERGVVEAQLNLALLYKYPLGGGTRAQTRRFTGSNWLRHKEALLQNLILR